MRSIGSPTWWTRRGQRSTVTPSAGSGVVTESNRDESKLSIVGTDPFIVGTDPFTPRSASNNCKRFTPAAIPPPGRKMKLPSRPQIKQLESVVANPLSRFFLLAACLWWGCLPAFAIRSDPLETRVGGSGVFASGQTSAASAQSFENTMGFAGCGYKTASGRDEWPNRDPINELGGINLYGMVANNPISYYDPLGLTDCSDPCGDAQKAGKDKGNPAGTVCCDGKKSHAFGIRTVMQVQRIRRRRRSSKAA